MGKNLPIKTAHYLESVLLSESEHPPPPSECPFERYMRWRKVRDLETVQVLLHLEGQETDAVVLRNESLRSDHFIERRGYHEEILGHWKQFATAHADNELEVFEIADIALPPAPFFRDHIVPILQNDSLMRLDLINCGLKSSDLSRGVAEVLKKCPTLISLSLAQNEIATEIDDAKCLSSAMAKHKELFIVDLSQCGLGESDDILSTILKGCKKLNSLDLRKNEFKSKSLALIAKFLSIHKTLKSLNVGGIKMDEKSVQALKDAVEKNKTLEELCLASSNNTLSTKAQFKLVLNDKLLHLDLSWVSLRTNGAKYIASHLKKNPPLAILGLRGSSLPNKSAESLCKALKCNTNLTDLDLRNSNFNDTSVPFFADMLRNNSTLITLDMTGNKMKIKSGRKDLINQALCNSTSLQAIAESNHTCLLTLNNGRLGEKETHEEKFWNINALENEGQKIRYKVIVSLFTMKTIAFHPRHFQDVPLELMPRLLELVQFEMGYGKYGREVWKAPIRRKGSNPRLTRVYEVIHGWTMLPSLFEVSYQLLFIYNHRDDTMLINHRSSFTARTWKDQEEQEAQARVCFQRRRRQRVDANQ